MTRYSRSTWCALFRSWPGGFLRSTYLPLGLERMKVGFDWPVGVFSASIGPLKPGSARLQVARERDRVDLGGLVRKRGHAALHRHPRVGVHPGASFPQRASG